MHPKSQSTGRKSRSNSNPNAIQILMADHQKVSKMFAEFEKTKDKIDDEEKQSLVKRACDELTIHAQVEEEIFYPALREALDDGELIDEAEVEHSSVKRLIEELESMQPGDELYDAKFIVMSEYVKHHVKEEQGEIFPKARKSTLDLTQLGQEIAHRKNQLKAQHGMETEQEDE